MLVGCQKDNLSELKNAEESNASKGGKVEVSAAAGYDATKAALGEADDSTMPVNWEENDILGVFFKSGFEKVNGVSVFPYDSISGKKFYEEIDFPFFKVTTDLDSYEYLPDVNILRLTAGAGTKTGSFQGSLYPTPDKKDDYYAYYPFQHYAPSVVRAEWDDGTYAQTIQRNGRGIGYAFMDRTNQYQHAEGETSDAEYGFLEPKGTPTLVLELPAKQDGKMVGFMTATDKDASYADGLSFKFKQLLPLLKIDIDGALVGDIDYITYNAKDTKTTVNEDYAIDLYKKSATDLKEVSDYKITDAYWTKVKLSQEEVAERNTVAGIEYGREGGGGGEDPKPLVKPVYRYYWDWVTLTFWRHDIANDIWAYWCHRGFLDWHWHEVGTNHGGGNEPNPPTPPTEQDFSYAWSLASHLRLDINSVPATTPNDFASVAYGTPTTTAETYGADYYITGAENETVLDNNYTWPAVEGTYNLYTAPNGEDKYVAGTFYTQFGNSGAHSSSNDFYVPYIRVNGDGSSSYTLVVPEAEAYETPVITAPTGNFGGLEGIVAGDVAKTLKSTSYAYNEGFDLSAFIADGYTIYTSTDQMPDLHILRTQAYSTVKPYETYTAHMEAQKTGTQPTVTVTFKDGTSKVYQIFDVALEGGKLYLKTVAEK